MSQSPLSLAGSEVSTRSSRFVSDSRVVQIKGEGWGVRGGAGITGSANRLSSVFSGRKLDGGTLLTHPHPRPFWVTGSVQRTQLIVLTGTLNQPQITLKLDVIFKVDFSLNEPRRPPPSHTKTTRASTHTHTCTIHNTH